MAEKAIMQVIVGVCGVRLREGIVTCLAVEELWPLGPRMTPVLAGARKLDLIFGRVGGRNNGMALEAERVPFRGHLRAVEAGRFRVRPRIRMAVLSRGVASFLGAAA